MKMQTEKGNEYVQLFESVRGRVGNDDVAVAIVDQVGKDHRVEQMQNGRPGSRGANSTNGNGDQAATPKQIAFLRTLGVKNFPAFLTKQQASVMIDEVQLKAAA